MNKMADFYVKLMKDKEHLEKVGAVLGDQSIDEADDEKLAKIGEIAKEMGFDISIEEAKTYLHSEEIEVSDEALDAVAGGEKGDYKCEGKNSGVRYKGKDRTFMEKVEDLNDKVVKEVVDFTRKYL